MKHLKFNKDSEIVFESNNDIFTTPAKAINEAIEFVKENGLESVDLIYNGFTMIVTKSTDLKELVGEYMEWAALYGKIKAQV